MVASFIFKKRCGWNTQQINPILVLSRCSKQLSFLNHTGRTCSTPNPFLQCNYCSQSSEPHWMVVALVASCLQICLLHFWVQFAIDENKIQYLSMIRNNEYHHIIYVRHFDTVTARRKTPWKTLSRWLVERRASAFHHIEIRHTVAFGLRCNLTIFPKSIPTSSALPLLVPSNAAGLHKSLQPHQGFSAS